jgi:hypothetical protein
MECLRDVLIVVLQRQTRIDTSGNPVRTGQREGFALGPKIRTRNILCNLTYLMSKQFKPDEEQIPQLMQTAVRYHKLDVEANRLDVELQASRRRGELFK